MRKLAGYFACLAVFFLFVLAAPSLKANREQEHRRIVEHVVVTNVEVPVRVLYKGEPVVDLTRDDFEVYENKKKLAINGFFLKRKKIAVTTKETQREEKPPPPLPSRTFVLVFSITHYNNELAKAVDHIFDKILRKNDRLLIFANNKTLEFPGLEEKEKIKRQLIADLKAESHKAKQILINYINKIESFLNVYDFRRQLSQRQDFPASRLVDFLEKYLVTWNYYKKMYLTPRLDHFYYFSKYLEGIKSEKWVFNFYQLELFPDIQLGSRTMDRIRELLTELLTSNEPTQYSYGKLVLGLLNRIYISLNVSEGFPTAEVGKLFYKVDATFHSFFIRSNNAGEFNDLEYNEVASNIEDTLKQITRITGGKSITSNDLVKSLETVEGKEDIYYILTYVPADAAKAGKLHIKVKNKNKGKKGKYNVFYDDNFRADYIAGRLLELEKETQTPGIKIDGFSFDRKILTFTVTDYLMKGMAMVGEDGNGEERTTGRAVVRVRLTDKDNNPLYDRHHGLTARKAVIKVTLGAFQKIKSGEYNFLIDALDLLTGKEATFHKNIMIDR